MKSSSKTLLKLSDFKPRFVLVLLLLDLITKLPFIFNNSSPSLVFLFWFIFIGDKSSII